jgi:hypothetical protein
MVAMMVENLSLVCSRVKSRVSKLVPKKSDYGERMTFAKAPAYPPRSNKADGIGGDK